MGLFDEVVVNEELAGSELESSTGGGWIKECGVYPMTIEKAFFTETKKGGYALTLHFGGQHMFEATIYPVISRGGKKVTTSTVKGKAVSLGDYKLLKQLMYVATGQLAELKDIKTEVETIKYKKFGKNVEEEGNTAVDLIGKEVQVGVRLEERYAYDKEAGEDDKTRVNTNDDGDILYDKRIMSLYHADGRSASEVVKNLEATQIVKDKEFLASDKGIKKVKLEASQDFEVEVEGFDDTEDKLDF